jgi:hypothetical protein
MRMELYENNLTIKFPHYNVFLGRKSVQHIESALPCGPYLPTT